MNHHSQKNLSRYFRKDNSKAQSSLSKHLSADNEFEHWRSSHSQMNLWHFILHWDSFVILRAPFARRKSAHHKRVLFSYTFEIINFLLHLCYLSEVKDAKSSQEFCPRTLMRTRTLNVESVPLRNMKSGHNKWTCWLGGNMCSDSANSIYFFARVVIFGVLYHMLVVF